MKPYQKEAIEYYKRWMKETTFSNALKAKVNITRKGLDHIISGSNSRKRSHSDKRMRLKLLKAAKGVIKDSNSYTSTNKNGETYYEIKGNAYSTKSNNEVKYFKVKVILKKDKKGNYFFFSVMKA